MNEKERNQYEQLVLTPIPALIPQLAVPTVISMMISMIYNLVDAYFVGRLGTSASASIGILLSLSAIFQAVGFLFGHGSGTNIVLHLGQGDSDAASRIASKAVGFALLFSLLLAVLGLVFLTPLMRLLGSTQTILPYSCRYGFYILVCGPALTLSCVLNNIMRYEGKAFYAMIGLVSGGVLNMIGDPILMFGFHMGIDGAGLSTAISQYVSLLILFSMFASGRTISRLSLRSFLAHAKDRKELGLILKNGSPSLVRQMLGSLSSLTLNVCSMPYGDAAIAAMAIVGRICMFLASAMIGIGQGFQPVSAYNYSARKYKRLRDSFVFTVKWSTVVLGIAALICLIFPAPLIRLFRDDPEVVRIGVLALRLQSIAIVLQPVTVTTNMLFQSIGRSSIASFTASLRSGLYYIPILLILPRLIGLTGIQSAQALADLLSVLTCAPLAIHFFRSTPHEDQEAPIDQAFQSTRSQS